MIGSLRGTLVSKQAPAVVVECNGVGYEVETPMSTFLNLPDVGKDIHLFTHLVVREDAHLLFGFAAESERRLFRSLLKVSGVGARMSLAILSTLTVSDFERCVEAGDTATLVKVPGIGKKTAERLVIEMRDRIDHGHALPGATRVTVGASPRSEAVDALVALGYNAREVNRLIGDMDVAGRSAEDIIRQALRQAAQ